MNIGLFVAGAVLFTFCSLGILLKVMHRRQRADIVHAKDEAEALGMQQPELWEVCVESRGGQREAAPWRDWTVSNGQCLNTAPDG